jgi:hypothetical protein
MGIRETLKTAKQGPFRAVFHILQHSPSFPPPNHVLIVEFRMVFLAPSFLWRPLFSGALFSLASPFLWRPLFSASLDWLGHLYQATRDGGDHDGIQQLSFN